MSAKTQAIDFSKIRQTFEQVGALLGEQKARREELAQERDRIAALPLHRADLIASVCEWIDSVRPAYLKYLQTVVAPLSRKPDRPLPESRNGDFGLISADGKVQPSAIFALLAPLLKDALSTAINELPIDDADAIPAEDRRSRLAKLDAEIDQLDAEIAELHQQAVAAGIIKIRRKPTREEINELFRNACMPSDPAGQALMIENLERRLNGEPPIKSPPLPAAPVTVFKSGELPDDF